VSEIMGGGGFGGWIFQTSWERHPPYLVFPSYLELHPQLAKLFSILCISLLSSSPKKARASVGT
jgi:hypothetical protein